VDPEHREHGEERRDALVGGRVQRRDERVRDDAEAGRHREHDEAHEADRAQQAATPGVGALEPRERGDEDVVDLLADAEGGQLGEAVGLVVEARRRLAEAVGDDEVVPVHRADVEQEREADGGAVVPERAERRPAQGGRA
jgi:hypothetical protein